MQIPYEVSVQKGKEGWVFETGEFFQPFKSFFGTPPQALSLPTLTLPIITTLALSKILGEECPNWFQTASFFKAAFYI